MPHSLFDVESESERSKVWIADVYIVAQGVQDDVVQADSNALLHVDSADVWASGVSFVAGASSMSRALSLKDSSMFLGGELVVPVLPVRTDRNPSELLALVPCLCSAGDSCAEVKYQVP